MFKEYIFPLESGFTNMLGTCIDLQCNILPYVKKSIKNIFFNHVDQMSYISIFKFFLNGIHIRIDINNFDAL